MIFAYFAPPGGMLRRIGRVGRRGRARIITAAKSDNNATIAAARHSYSRLLRRHVEMYEYQPAKLHTKLAIVDDVVHIGSSNFDYRSLYINMEMMLRIKDAGVRRRDAQLFRRRARQQQLDHARAAQAAARRLWRRIKWAVSHFLVNIMDYTVTRRLNFRRGALGLRLALVGPEQGRRRDVDPFEAALDRLEMGLDEIAHLGAELIDQERAAGTDDVRVASAIASPTPGGRVEKGRPERT